MGVPEKQCVRFRKCVKAIVGIGDASGSAFGNSYISNEGISYSFGTWGPETSSQSSNYREFRNVLDSFITEGEAGRLCNALVIFATDNGLVETAIYKGSSSSKELHDMVIEFYRIQFKYNFVCLVIHVAGT